MAGRALIIDKDAAFTERLEASLRETGLDVETRMTGREGIERAREAPPDLIVLCVELDDTSGYSICAKVKKDPDLKAIPLIITSEKATQEMFDHHKKLKTRAQAYLMKPFEPEVLLEAAREHLELPGSGDGSSGSLVGEIPIEDVDVDMAAPGATGDDDAFGDTGAELDQAIASLSDEPPPLPDELGIEGRAGLPEELDEDDVHTTIGQVPSSGGPRSSGSSPRSGGSMDLPPPELLRRLKEAERARDEAVASERSTRAQLEALAAGASQIPAASSASREVLAVKKELNAKEREVLELRDKLQERDKQLLAARDREAELEEKVVQTEEARSNADRARVEAESKIAGAEARAEEIDRSSKAAIAELDGQVEDARQRIEGLENDLDQARSEIEGLHGTVADRDARIEERDNALAARDARIGELEAELEARQRDLAAAHEEIEGLNARIENLESDLAESRGEADALRAALADTEDRLNHAIQRIREDEDIRSKARQAIEITLNLLSASDYAPEEGGTPSSVGDDVRAIDDALSPS